MPLQKSYCNIIMIHRPIKLTEDFIYNWSCSDHVQSMCWPCFDHDMTMHWPCSVYFCISRDNMAAIDIYFEDLSRFQLTQQLSDSTNSLICMYFTCWCNVTILPFICRIFINYSSILLTWMEWQNNIIKLELSQLWIIHFAIEYYAIILL